MKVMNRIITASILLALLACSVLAQAPPVEPKITPQQIQGLIPPSSSVPLRKVFCNLPNPAPPAPPVCDAPLTVTQTDLIVSAINPVVSSFKIIRNGLVGVVPLNATWLPVGGVIRLGQAITATTETLVVEWSQAP